MKPDVLGFLYPEVDKTKCTDCGLCDKVCAFNDNYDKSLNISVPIAYAARHKDMTEMMKSQSGGAFAVLSDYVLENGGVVYGAGYNGHFVVTHKRATTKEERDEFRGSKYVQSDLTGIFKQVKDDLQNGLTVMFSGTPCQTSGLNSFVGKKLREKLYLVDLVCHGVPGPFMWRDYLDYLEMKYNRKIVKVNFRDKVNFGWKSHKETFWFEGFTSFTSFTSFTDVFYQHIALRLSCGKCHFTNLTRPSDVSICDYWGCERTDAKLGEDNKGCSLMIINTEKGKALFESIKDRMNVTPAKLDNILQPNMEHPTVLHKNRLKFEEHYQKYGFTKTFKKYATTPWYARGYKFVRRCTVKVLREFGLKK
jgi:coenzyme F420-reducing hydrogenase beta subunit